ncbi:MAG: hypothetical protein R2844_03855 [Caldilineales bacterium]
MSGKVRHLTDLDSLREGIGLRHCPDPAAGGLQEEEAYEMFQELMGSIEGDIVRDLQG